MSIKVLPIVAIVGQPNAGKSTLMNKIIRKPLAVTSDIAGTTRDRQYVDTTWSGVDFTLLDTAGLSLDSKQKLKGLDKKGEEAIAGELEEALLKQIEVALDEADIVVLVVDGKEPVSAVNTVTIKKFREHKKPLLLAVNKLDAAKSHTEKLVEFQKLGIKNVFPISSVSGLGIGDMLEHITDELKKMGLNESKKEDDRNIAISIVGKPNVGKSSLFNKILKEERVVVSPIPGTTRTAIDSQINIKGVDYTFIDTAGLKKKEFRQTQPEIFSGFQTFKAIRRSDICFFVIDTLEELTKQDQRVAQEIFAMDKGCIILANKCDLITEKDNPGENTKSITKNQDDRYHTVRDYISHHFPFLWMCPLFFVSAVTGEGLDEALSAIQPIWEKRNKTIDEDELQEYLKKKLKVNPPKLLRDQKPPKVYALKQPETNPPKFELLVNHPAAISTQFRKYLENAITKELDFYGTPITLKLKGKDKA